MIKDVESKRKLIKSNEMENIYNSHIEDFRVCSYSIHALGAIHFFTGLYIDWFHAVIPSEVSPIHNAFGYKLKFLTNWNVVIQAVYFTLCTIEDHTKNESLQRVKQLMYAGLAFPLAMFVGSTFWGLMAVDRELVLPEALDPYFPWWLNHMMHTNIMVFQLLETFTSPHIYPGRGKGVGCILGLLTCYMCWMFVLHGITDLWVYPVFDKLNALMRILFLAGNLTTGLLFYFVGEKLNKALWGDSETNKKE